jgi:hypothetical protein
MYSVPCGSWQLQQIIEKLAQDQANPWSRLFTDCGHHGAIFILWIGKSIAVPIKVMQKIF